MAEELMWMAKVNDWQTKQQKVTTQKSGRGWGWIDEEVLRQSREQVVTLPMFGGGIGPSKGQCSLLAS